MNIASTNFLLIVGVAITITLMGCAGSGAPQSQQSIQVQQEILTSKIDNIEKEMAQWKQMKPSVARLVVIENDLKELIVQLSSMAEEPELTSEAKPEVKQTQAIEKSGAADVKQSPKPTPEVTAASQAKVQTAAAYPTAPEQPIEVSLIEKNEAGFLVGGHAGGKYALQLSSVTNPWVIEQQWFELQKKYASALGGVIPTYERASIKGVTYFRIKVGQFNKRKQAKQACAQLKNIGGSCVVTLNNGVPYRQLNKQGL